MNWFSKTFVGVLSSVTSDSIKVDGWQMDVAVVMKKEVGDGIRKREVWVSEFIRSAVIITKWWLIGGLSY